MNIEKRESRPRRHALRRPQIRRRELTVRSEQVLEPVADRRQHGRGGVDDLQRLLGLA